MSVPTPWLLLAFTAGLAAATLLLACSALSCVVRDFHFWPPEPTKPWQHRLFWIPFRIFMVSLLAVCALDYRGAINSEPAPLWFSLVGWPLAAMGFGAALYLTHFLGWRTAYSIEPQRLPTDGIFARSRNPIYVVTVAGMGGLGLAIASWWAAVLLTLWAAFYLLAPLLEEPWLEQTYGQAYLDYKNRTPRFFN